MTSIKLPNKSQIKFVSTLLVGAGTLKITNSIIDSNITTDGLKPLHKAQVKAGRWAIAGVIVVKTKKFTDEAIDEIYDAIDQAKALFAKHEETDEEQ